METLIKYRVIRSISWLIVIVAVSPLLTASAEPRKWTPCNERQRLEWLLAKHDVRNAIYAPLAEHVGQAERG